jgi:hypothetical protein
MPKINLIYLGILTDRLPIIGQFTPSHIGGHVPPIDFGDVFDVPRLRELMQKPLIQWHEVKDRSSDIVEELGCWNVWEAVQDREHFARRSAVPDRLNLGKISVQKIRFHFAYYSLQIFRIPNCQLGLN